MRRMIPTKKIDILNRMQVVNNAVDVEGAFTADEIAENMSGYSFTAPTVSFPDLNIIYAGVVKTGNKITFVIFCSFTYDTPRFLDIGTFNIPKSVYDKLYPYDLNDVATLDTRSLSAIKERQSVPIQIYGEIFKPSGSAITFSFATNSSMTASETYIVRYEATFLLSENLAE